MLVTGQVKMLQGVRDVYEIVDMENQNHAQGSSNPLEGRITKEEGKLVFIGKGMVEDSVRGSLRAALKL